MSDDMKKTLFALALAVSWVGQAWAAPRSADPLSPSVGLAAQNVTVLGRVVTSVSGGAYNDALFVHDALVFSILFDSVRGTYALQVYDASNPAAPVLVSTIPVPGPPPDQHGIYYSNGLLYVGITVRSAFAGFYIYDLSVPAAPVQLSWTEIGWGVHNLTLAGNYLYTTPDLFGFPDILVFDVQDPTAPVPVNQYHLNGGAYCHDLTVMEGVGYASMWDDGLYLLDLSDPTRSPLPVLASGPTGWSTHSAWPAPDLKTVVTSHEGFDLGVNLWDVTSVPFRSLANYQSHATVVPPNTSTIVHDVMVVGSFAYITYYPEGLRILDISNPAAPVEVGSLVTGSPCYDYCSAIAQWVEDGRVYVLDMNSGLWILSFDLPHDAPLTLYAAKANAGQDVAMAWNYNGEKQYTVRRYLNKASVAGASLNDVDGAIRFSDPGAVPDTPPNAPLFYYRINGPWR